MKCLACGLEASQAVEEPPLGAAKVWVITGSHKGCDLCKTWVVGVAADRPTAELKCANDFTEDEGLEVEAIGEWQTHQKNGREWYISVLRSLDDFEIEYVLYECEVAVHG